MPLNPNIPLSVNIPQSEPFNPLATLQQLQQIRGQAEQRAYLQQKMQREQQEEADRRADEQRKQQQANILSDAYKQAFNPETGDIDEKVISTVLTQAGYGSAVPNILEGLYKEREAHQKTQAADVGYIKTVAGMMVDANFADPVVNGLLTVVGSRKKAVQPFEEMWRNNPDQFKAVVTKMATAPEADYTLSPGQKRFKGDKVVAEVPPTPPTPDKPPALGSFEDYLKRQYGPNPTPDQIVKAKASFEPPKPPAVDTSKMWVVRDGKPIRISEAEYRPGDLPANTREQGRPVTSGDAGRVADFDTSLSDIGVLRSTLTTTKGSTGTSAYLGTKAPAWSTDLLGWGAGPKSRQATIDRVKQVIGKTLEGGVLRKEDELKYEKILPTIFDTQQVAEAKLDGLEKAITQRRSTFLDALADANYDVDKFTQRSTSQVGGTTRMRAPNGDERDVPNDQVEAFKRKGATVVK